MMSCVALARIISKLEDFCSSAQFTTFLGEFTQQHANKFQHEGFEQPIECYSLWNNFKAEIDT